ncbi:hypothetical protein GCM10020001_002580 [Nonomuraea salmonea]
MAARTVARVSGRTLGESLSTRETVWYDTPAAAATSLMLGTAASRDARGEVGATSPSYDLIIRPPNPARSPHERPFRAAAVSTENALSRNANGN